MSAPTRDGCFEIPSYRIAQRLRVKHLANGGTNQVKRIAAALVVFALCVAAPDVLHAKAGGPGASSGGGNNGENGNGGNASGGVGGVGSGGNGNGVGGADGSGPGGNSGDGGGNGGGGNSGGSGPGGNGAGPSGGSTGSAGSGTGPGADGAGEAGDGALTSHTGLGWSTRIYRAWDACRPQIYMGSLTRVLPDGRFAFETSTPFEAQAMKACLTERGFRFAE